MEIITFDSKQQVKGFLANNGRNYVYSSYWKVYQDLQGALQTFKRYDEDRDFVIRAVMSGKTIREIASGG